MGFEKTIVKTITISDVQIPDTPQISIKNPTNIPIFVNSIALISDISFTTRGKVVVVVGGSNVFEPDDSNDLQFKNRPSIPIPLNNKQIDPSETIDVFAWNSIDTNPISLTVEIQLSEEKGNSVGSGASSNLQISPSDVRRRNSINEIVFAQKDYSSEIVTKLIDMEGYTKMILGISGSSSLSPVVIQDDFGFNDTSLTVDLNLSTLTDLQFALGTKDFIVDFLTISSRIPSSKINAISTGSNNLELAVSDDNVSYSTVDSITSVSTGDHTLQGIQQNFRYLRLRYIYVSGSANQTAIYQMYDGLKLGGTASISFEILDMGSNQWIEIISSADLGTVTTGGSISKQIGDVIDSVVNNKFNAILPSSPTDFRAKLTVLGNINTGVSIIKVD